MKRFQLEELGRDINLLTTLERIRESRARISVNLSGECTMPGKASELPKARQGKPLDPSPEV